MKFESPKLSCPVCNTPISVDNKHWVVTCSGCKKEIQIISRNEKFVTRGYISQTYSENNVEFFGAYVKSNFSLEKWGFSQSSKFSNGYIFDSKFCRVKFEFGRANYYPLYETSIYYGKSHAKDHEKHITWNGEKCLCWHENIYITLSFIEGISAQKLADGGHRELWQSLVDNFKIDCPIQDYLEYPLRFHAKIWEYYGEKFFSVFDLRNTALWEEYSKYSNEYNEARNEARSQKWSLSPRAVEKIC